MRLYFKYIYIITHFGHKGHTHIKENIFFIDIVNSLSLKK